MNCGVHGEIIDSFECLLLAPQRETGKHELIKTQFKSSSNGQKDLTVFQNET